MSSTRVGATRHCRDVDASLQSRFCSRMPDHTPEEQPLLDAVDKTLATPTDSGNSALLLEAWRKLPSGHVYSPHARERVTALAARRKEQPRDVLHMLVAILRKVDHPEAIAFMLDILADDGLSTGGIDGLDVLDPVVVAPHLRAWLAGRDPGALANPLMVRALRAKTDLAAPPASGDVVKVDEDLLEYWMQRGDLAAMRLALAGGASGNSNISHGETLLHYALDCWANASEDEDSDFNPSQAQWEAFIGELIAAGADPDRKLVNRFTGTGERRWPKGTTARAMLDGERKRGELSEEVIDRLEARFPAAAGAAKARAKKKAAAPAPKPAPRDISFRRQVDEPLAGLRGTPLEAALDKVLAEWTDEVLAGQPFGPWGYASTILEQMGEQAPDAMAKAHGWLSVLGSPQAQRVYKIVVVGSREEARLLNDMSLATLERDMERLDLAGWADEAVALIKKETRLAYRDGAFLIGKKKGDTTVLWEATREGVTDLGNVQSFLTSLVAAARTALAR
ncbi:Trehalose synthase [Minicystis rosea]|nr:Trehalose synthase [Minicystis rosea]